MHTNGNRLCLGTTVFTLLTIISLLETISLKFSVNFHKFLFRSLLCNMTESQLVQKTRAQEKKFWFSYYLDHPYNHSRPESPLYFEQNQEYGLWPQPQTRAVAVIVSWFSNRTGTSVATALAEKTPMRIQNRIDSTLFFSILNSHW